MNHQDIIKGLGAQLAQVARSTGTTKAEIIRRSGVSRPAIIALFCGKPSTFQTVVRVADALGVDVDVAIMDGAGVCAHGAGVCDA